MRKPASFLDDFSLNEDDEKINYADPLCCPDDPLDEVLMYIPTLDPKILEALGIDCSSPPPPHDGLLGYSPSAEEDFSVSYLESAGAAGHMVSSYPTASAPSSTSWESESSDRASSFRYWDVPTKPRRKQVAVRKRAWSHPFLDFPSTPMVAADHDTHSINSGNASFGEFSAGNASKLSKLSLDDDDGNFSKPGHRDDMGKFSSSNCGGGHRRSAGRQRDRQKKGTICSHCHATETPQWRTGPGGPGTLCNACGIRYRMGRDKLVPEYLPSTSPFFRSGEHSNRHSKVEKLREKKVKALKVGFGATDALTPARSNGNVDSSFI